MSPAVILLAAETITGPPVVSPCVFKLPLCTAPPLLVRLIPQLLEVMLPVVMP
jgi:hypothetical protein